MKKYLLIVSLFFTVNIHAQLTSLLIGLSDTTLYCFNPSTGDTIQLTKLPKTVYQGIGSGTAYNVTATAALVDMGTSDPTITIAKAGTYLIFWNVRTDYALATLAVSRSMTYKIRRTNNTAADINLSGFSTPLMTLLSFSGPDISRQFVYSATAGDILQIWASVNTIPTAGAISVPEANIIALRLY